MACMSLSHARKSRSIIVPPAERLTAALHDVSVSSRMHRCTSVASMSLNLGAAHAGAASVVHVHHSQVRRLHLLHRRRLLSSSFDDDHFIYLQLSLKRTPNRSTTKPYPLPTAPPSLHGRHRAVPHHQRPAARQGAPHGAVRTTTAPNAIKQYFAAHPVPGLSSRHRRDKAEKGVRAVQRAAGVAWRCTICFWRTTRIVPLLPAVLGVKFFDKKKQPIPVDLRRTAKEKSITGRAALHVPLFTHRARRCRCKVGRT